MKFKGFFARALALGVSFSAIGAADDQARMEKLIAVAADQPFVDEHPAGPTIIILNQTGHEVELYVGKVIPGSGGLQSPIKPYPVVNKEYNKEYSISDGSSIKVLAARFKWARGGVPNTASFEPMIDPEDLVSGLNQHPGDTLVIKIEAKRDTWATLNLKFAPPVWRAPAEGAAMMEGFVDIGAQEPQAEPAFVVPLKGTPYEMLGVPENASQREIANAFRRLAPKHYSDREVIKRVQSAYIILNNEDNLATYNRSRNTPHAQRPYEFKYLWPEAYWPDE